MNKSDINLKYIRIPWIIGNIPTCILNTSYNIGTGMRCHGHTRDTHGPPLYVPIVFQALWQLHNLDISLFYPNMRGVIKVDILEYALSSLILWYKSTVANSPRVEPGLLWDAFASMD